MLDKVDRTEDVIGVLKNIANGKLKDNIALPQSTVYIMRYNEISKDFFKLFRGKGLRFFTGLKGEGLNDGQGEFHLKVTRNGIFL